MTRRRMIAASILFLLFVVGARVLRDRRKQRSKRVAVAPPAGEVQTIKITGKPSGGFVRFNGGPLISVN